MDSLSRPDLKPNSSLSTGEMKALQREIAAAATFSDEGVIDPASLSARGIVDVGQAGDAAEDDPSGGSADGGRPLVAGVDQSFVPEDETAISAIVVVTPTGDGRFETVERVHAITDLEIPYVPGLLAFREGGPILEAVSRLSVEPDLYLFDGSGRIHFREAGIATHVGVLLDAPSVGVAKRLLCGEPTESTAGLDRGERVPIVADDRVETETGTLLGYAVQTKQFDSPNRHVNPLYVSPGHRVSAETAAALVLACVDGYKLPEPVRMADAYAAEKKRE